MHYVQPVENLASPVENLRQIRRRCLIAALLGQPLTEIGLESLHDQHRLTIDQSGINQGDNMPGLIGIQAVQKDDLPLQMRPPVTAQARIDLSHRLGIDQLESDGAAGGIGRRPDLTIAARAGGQHGVQPVVPVINRQCFTAVHGRFSRPAGFGQD